MTHRQIGLISVFAGYLLLAITVYRWQLFTHFIATIVFFKGLVPVAFVLFIWAVIRLFKLPFWAALLTAAGLETASYLYIRHTIEVNTNADRHEVGVLSKWVNYRDVIQFNRHFSSYSPDLGYRLRPGADDVHSSLEYSNAFKINSFGVRDDEASLENPKLVFVGDSFTMGWGVDQDQTYADQTGRKLGVKTLNAGISSYGTYREMLLFSKIKRDSCRLLVLQYCDNDLEENQARNEPANQGQLLTPATFDNTAVFNRINETYYPMRFTYFFVREKDLLKRIWTSPLQVFGEIGGALSAWVKGEQHAVVTPPDIKTPEETRLHTGYFYKSLAKIRRYYQGNIIVLHLDGRYTRPEMIRAFEAEGRQPGDAHLYFLHTDELLSAHDYYPVDGHIKASGHAKISDALVKMIREKALLTP
ncbi:hypothetical protein GCM10010967_29630 [Dyadobacter beijingensis]|uniref:SGNH hydrolase-type esterase domain-containing protein n=1 Tax=Dyadobacter beijingensis TaxID=365489 RepID=A0ABQ2HXE0_9BACT|nr:hypothetical protein [Dyadobacter beijingensis]GGM94451.1 hypothetical protein GCM10010967_29630 [Dyadobacter beijingensis]